MNNTKNTREAHLVFSEDKTTCHVVFANGSESMDEYDDDQWLLEDLSSMLKKKKISEVEHANLVSELLEKGPLSSKEKSLVLIAVVVSKKKNPIQTFCPN